MSTPAKVTPKQAWPFVRLLAGDQTVDGLDELPKVLNHAAVYLESLPVDARGTSWPDIWGALGPLGSALEEAVRHQDPNGPEPEGEEETKESRGWPPLRQPASPAGLPFPLGVLPEPIRAYCQELAASTKGPVDFAGCAVLVVAGAAVGKAVKLRLKSTWLELTLLFLAMVARPGRSKTPIQSFVVAPLEAIDIRLRQESDRARREWEEATRRRKGGSQDDLSPGREPPGRKAVVRDITRESLCLVLQDNPRGVLADTDELSGWVQSFNEYRSKGQDRQFWLALYSNKRIVVDRKGGKESISVADPFVSVLGGLQPEMLSALKEEKSRDDGFVDRILFSFPDDSSFPPDQWSEEELPESSREAWERVVKRLAGVGAGSHEQGTTFQPHIVSMTPEAKEEWARWYNDHAADGRAPDFDERFEGAWAKMKGLAGRLALILCCLRWAVDETVRMGRDGNLRFVSSYPAPVTVEDVRGAAELIDYFKSHARRVRHFQTAGLANGEARSILSWIRRGEKKEFSESELTDDLRRFQEEPETLAQALNALSGYGAIRKKETPEQKRRGRRASARYEVHPDLTRSPE